MAKIELKTDAASWGLRAAAILGVIYGFGFLLMPSSLFQLSGDPGAPSNPGWVRWAGGFVLGIAIGPWLASEGWVKEQPFIAGVAAAFTHSNSLPRDFTVSTLPAFTAEQLRRCLVAHDSHRSSLRPFKAPRCKGAGAAKDEASLTT